MKEVKTMHELLRYIDDNMKEYEDKVARGGELSRSDVECIKDLAKTKMAILTNEAMENETRKNMKKCCWKTATFGPLKIWSFGPDIWTNGYPSG